MRSMLSLPASMRADGLGLRLETEADVPFLRRLYVSIREDELASLLDWSLDQKLAFLEQQFAAQRHHYGTHYIDTVFQLIEMDGVPIGRLYLDRGNPVDTRVVDLAFLPEWRGRGLGTAFLSAVFDEAFAQGRAVSIHVEDYNPARRLYYRLGFREVEARGPYWLMRREAGSGPTTAPIPEAQAIR